MRLLINHDPESKGHLPLILRHLKENSFTGVASSTSYDYTQLQETAVRAKADAIVLAHTGTLRKLLGEDKAITLPNMRGTRINYQIPCVVTAPIEHMKTVTHGDWLMGKDIAKFHTVRKPAAKFSFRVADTFELLNTLRHEASQALVNSHDVETDDALRITCISFALLLPNATISTWLIPFYDFSVCHYADDSLHEYALETMRLVLKTEAAKCAFNSIYDSQYEIKYGAEPRNQVLDPMILGWAEYSELPRALDFHASLELYDYFQWKHESDEAKQKKDIKGYWAYCAKDSWNTLRVLLCQLKRLNKHSYQLFNYQETLPLIYPALYTAYEGVLIDREEAGRLKAAAVIKRDSALKDLKAMAADSAFNPGSWQQVGKLLYDYLGAAKQKKTVWVGGQRSQVDDRGTDEAHLNRIAIQHPLLARVAGDILTYRGQAKALSTYYLSDNPADPEESGVVLMNDRLLYNLDPSGTESGRHACKASSFWCGTQIQNIPGYAKSMMVADPGFELFEVDKNKSEARCVAYLAQCLAMIEALENKEKDFYKVCASYFFGIPYDEVTKELRNEVVKRIIHGSNYLLGAETFVDTASPQKLFVAMAMLNSPIKNLKEFAAYLLSLYHKPFPELKQSFYPGILQEVSTTGRMVSPLGWTRVFFGNPRTNQQILRGAIAHQPQNLSVHMLNRGYRKIYRMVLEKPEEIRLKAQIHDSVWGQWRIELRQKYAPLVLEAVRHPVTIHGRVMDIPSDLKVGQSWGKMEEYDPYKKAA